MKTVATAFAILIAMNMPAASEQICFKADELAKAFKMVFPNIRQSSLIGVQAQEYLDAYNQVGKPTDYNGDKIVFNFMPSGHVGVLVVDSEGNVCKRFIAGGRLHKLIMRKIEGSGSGA